VRLSRRDLVQQSEHPGHGVVVEGDVRKITRVEGKELRPAAVAILRGEEIVETAVEGLNEARLGTGGNYAGEEGELGPGGAIVDGGLGVGRRRGEPLFLSRRQGPGHIDILGPAADGALIEEHIFSGRGRPGLAEPGGIVMHQRPPDRGGISGARFHIARAVDGDAAAAFELKKPTPRRLDHHPFEGEIADILQLHAGAGGDVSVADADILNRHLRQAGHDDGPGGAGTVETVDGDIAENGGFAGDRPGQGVGLTALVKGVEADRLADDILHADVADADIFNDPAAAARALEAQADIGADECAVLDADIAHAAVGIAADDKTAMAVVDDAVADEDVLQSGARSSRTVAGLHANAVISGSYGTPLNQHVAAGADIDAVPVLRPPFIIHFNVSDDQLIAPGGTESELGRILDGHALEKHPLAIDERDHVGPQVIARRKMIFGGDLLFGFAFLKLFKIVFPLHRFTGGPPHLPLFVNDSAGVDQRFPLPGGGFEFLHRPPALPRPVNDPNARNGDILETIAVEG